MEGTGCVPVLRPIPRQTVPGWRLVAGQCGACVELLLLCSRREPSLFPFNWAIDLTHIRLSAGGVLVTTMQCFTAHCRMLV